MYKMTKNKCQWLTIGSTEKCDRNCLGEYCFIHNARLKKSRGTKPCNHCGKRVKNIYMLCHDCGYHCTYNKHWNRKDRAKRKEQKEEFLRLSSLEYDP